MATMKVAVTAIRGLVGCYAPSWHFHTPMRNNGPAETRKARVTSGRLV